MKNVKLDVKKKGIEVLVVTVSAERDDGTKVSRDIDLGGNATVSALWGARTVVDALAEMEK